MKLPHAAERGIVGAVAAVTLVTGGCEAAPSEVNPTLTPPSVDASSDLHSQSIEIYPVTLQAEGFGPADYDPAALRTSATAGWLTLSRATNGVITPEVSVAVEPARTLRVPGLASVVDLCSSNEGTALRQKLIDEVVPKHGGHEPILDIVVLKRAGHYDVNCPNGLAGPGGPITIYGAATDLTLYAHEMAHTKGAGHDNQMVYQYTKTGDRIMDSGQALEYGNAYTIMGGSTDPKDPDPFSAIALRQFGSLSSGQVRSLGENERHEHVKLTALTDTKDTTNVKLITVPIKPTAIYSHPKEGEQSALVDCARSVGIELSMDQTTYDGKNGLGLKVYAIGSDPQLPETYMLQERKIRYTIDGQALPIDRVGLPTTYGFGGKLIDLMVQSSDSRSATINLEVTDSPATMTAAC